MTAKALPYLLSGILRVALGIAIGALLFMWCNRQPEPIEKLEQLPAEVIRQKAVNVDSLKSQIEAEYRAPFLAKIKADSIELAKLRAKLPKSKDKATTSVKQYENAPSIAKCDTAIAELQHYVSEIETGLSISDSIMRNQGRVITSYAGTVRRKDSTIVTLGQGWETANLENAKLGRKVKNRNKLLKIGAGVIALLIGAVAVK